MLDVIGNNLATIINARAKKAQDFESQRAADHAELAKFFPKHRLTGLIKGTYGINLREAAIAKRILEVDSIDDVIIIKMQPDYKRESTAT